MIYDPMSGALYSDNGEFLKTVRCPLALKPHQLEFLGYDTDDKYCQHCKRSITCLDNLSDQEVRSSLLQDPTLCVFATKFAKNITFLSSTPRSPSNFFDLPIIITLRNLPAMKSAQQKGFRLIFRDTGEDTSNGEEKYILYQNKHTGALWWSSDYRRSAPEPEALHAENDWGIVRDWFFARSDRQFPLAAYAIPKNIAAGERVFIEDLIEDSFSETWNQGNSERRKSSGATWTGEDLLIDSPDDLAMNVG